MEAGDGPPRSGTCSASWAAWSTATRRAAWETADRYLSGDVRAQAGGGHGGRRARSGLRAQYRGAEGGPARRSAAGRHQARLGSSWIPASDIREFVAALLDTAPRNVRVGHAGAHRDLDGRDRRRREIQRRQHHDARHGALPRLRAGRAGAQRPHADRLRRATRTTRVINQQETIAAREKQQKLKDRFREWIWQDGARAARLARDYNDRFNNLRLRTFDGSHLSLPGMNRRVSARRRPRQAPERCRLADRAKRQHAAGALSWARARPGRWPQPPWKCGASASRKSP